jgi:hypothetical protein
MALSLNVADVFHWFQERGVHDRQSILIYVEEIANAARELADLWCSSIAALPDAEKSNQIKFGRQTFLCTQIEGFYGSASKVIAGRLRPEQRERLFFLLGAFLDSRRQATLMHCRAVTNYLDPNSRHNQAEIIEQARQLGNLLQANAADLQLLVSEIRAAV